MGITRTFSNLASIITTDVGNSRIGIGSTIPTEKLDVVGITSVGVGKTVSSTGILNATANSVNHLDTTDSVNISSNITATNFVGFGSHLIGIGYTEVAIIRDKKDNEHGGSFTGGAWRTRDLTESVRLSNIGGSLSNNEFSLVGGTYVIEFNCPSVYVNYSSTRLWNVSAGEEVGTGATNTVCQHGYIRNVNYVGHNRIYQKSAKIILTGITTFRIEHQCSYYGNTVGFGFNWSDSPNGNYYTMVRIYKGN